MPFFKTTYNILKAPDKDELHDASWLKADVLTFPPRREWDYSRELTIEDVDIWEQIYCSPGYLQVYASWSPYAEFYMIIEGPVNIQTFYGPGAQQIVQQKMREFDVNFVVNEIWVEPEDMWLYEKPKPENALLLQKLLKKTK